MGATRGFPWCTRVYNDRPIIAAYSLPHLNQTYTISQEGFRVINSTTHSVISAFTFPFNDTQDFNLEQQKGMAFSPQSVSGTIVAVHCYETSFSFNIVLIFSLGFVCHISNSVLLHIERLPESISTSVLFTYKNANLFLACGTKNLYACNLESLAVESTLAMPPATSFNLGQDPDQQEHSYPIEVAFINNLFLLLYNTGHCVVCELQEMEKHTLDFNLVLVGIIDLTLSSVDKAAHMFQAFSNLSVIAQKDIETQGDGVGAGSSSTSERHLLVFYLESIVRMDNVVTSMSATAYTEASFLSVIRAVSLAIPEIDGGVSGTSGTTGSQIIAQFYNLNVTSQLLQMFVAPAANTLPGRVLSLAIINKHLVLHVIDDSLTMYKLSLIDSEKKTIQLEDVASFQPIHRYMRSIADGKRYDRAELEYITEGETTFTRHIVLDRCIKRLTNRTHSENKILESRIPFIYKHCGGSPQTAASGGAYPTSPQYTGRTESAGPTGKQINRQQGRDPNLLIVIYASTAFFIPITFMDVHETPGLPGNFLPEIITPHHMQRLGCTPEPLPSNFLTKKDDIFAKGVTSALSTQDDASYDCLPIQPHKLLYPARQSNRGKYLEIVSTAFPEHTAFLEEVRKLLNDPLCLTNSDYLVAMASIHAIFNTFRAEQRTLELRSYDAGIKSVQAAICATFPPVCVIKDRFIVLPLKTKLVTNYGFPKKPVTVNTPNVMLPAWDLFKHTIVAAKIYPLTLSEKHFLRVYRQLSHKGIFSFIDCGVASNNALYIFTDAPPRLKLSTVFRNPSVAFELFRSERRVKVFVRSLLQAICFLFMNDTTLIHRDLRPGQIWVSQNKSTDPVAKLYHIGFMTSLAASEPVEYNTVWVAPEIVCGGIDVKSDVWSIGTITFRLLEVLIARHRKEEIRYNKLFCPCFQDISKVPSFAPGNGERNLLVANNAVVVNQMMMMASDKVEVSPDRYAVYTPDNFEEANTAAKIPWSMRRAYFAATGILPWQSLSGSKYGVKKSECGNLQAFFQDALQCSIISPEAIDFIEKCWVFSLSKRPSPDVLLKHSWLMSSSSR